MEPPPEFEYRIRDAQRDREPASAWSGWKPLARPRPSVAEALRADPAVIGRQYAFVQHEYRRGPGFVEAPTGTCGACARTLVLTPAGRLPPHDRSPNMRVVCPRGGMLPE